MGWALSKLLWALVTCWHVLLFQFMPYYVVLVKSSWDGFPFSAGHECRIGLCHSNLGPQICPHSHLISLDVCATGLHVHVYWASCYASLCIFISVSSPFDMCEYNWVSVFYLLPGIQRQLLQVVVTGTFEHSSSPKSDPKCFYVTIFHSRKK